ncbi:MAG: orotate phosphoribosyltransferase [Oscillospiraceae bacterium]|nr:orotate phosphoribosyltransferase [Oscillospiraceae bacterium]MBR3537438.1 orotate phosphoribosyltransferase [Oscillospiraceae bacterium]MBR6836010.1 orotate phosphoribosyltransferase [Oscillospiraceae bacterium]
MSYKNDFIKFMTECGVLTFGDFTLKSGRKAPYFVNTGNYKTGKQLAKLGEFYAECIKDHGISPDTLFGPAYKGIPLAVSCSVALFNKYGMDVNYCFDRKEAKDHGEGGVIVGKQLTDGEKVVIIEDVITAGTAIRQVIPVLKNAADVKIEAMVISVDRMEKGKEGDLSAVQEVKRDFGIEVFSIVTIEDIIKAIEDGVIEGKEYLDRMLEYRKTYGI